MKRMKNYVFKESNNQLIFVGDFDGLYKDDEDPWHQSGASGEIKDYYEYSRKKLNSYLTEVYPTSLLEVGCGLGYTTQILQKNLPNCHIDAVDISEIAIQKAKKLFPNLSFSQGDISDLSFKTDKKYDVIVLNQLLWYVLQSLDTVFENCQKCINENGRIVISQAFLKSEQKYGKDICNGFEGLLKYLNGDIQSSLKIEYHEYNASTFFLHNNGIVSLRKSK
jgi:SAM-dependent methyltransferase